MVSYGFSKAEDKRSLRMPAIIIGNAIRQRRANSTNAHTQIAGYFVHFSLHSFLLYIKDSLVASLKSSQMEAWRGNSCTALEALRLSNKYTEHIMQRVCYQ